MPRVSLILSFPARLTSFPACFPALPSHFFAITQSERRARKRPDQLGRASRRGSPRPAFSSTRGGRELELDADARVGRDQLGPDPIHRELDLAAITHRVDFGAFERVGGGFPVFSTDFGVFSGQIDPTAIGFTITAILFTITEIGFIISALVFTPTALTFIIAAIGFLIAALVFPIAAISFTTTALVFLITAIGFIITALTFIITALGFYSTALAFYPTALDFLVTARGFLPTAPAV